MIVEFLVNQGINDGREILIQESEFKKAKDATECLFAYYGRKNDIIRPDEYEKILSNLEKGGAVIITIVEDRYSREL